MYIIDRAVFNKLRDKLLKDGNVLKAAKSDSGTV